MNNVEHYYKVLELEPGASLEEVHQGYRDLALVWHPDRFPNHPRLQQKAQTKFQEINEAHDKLRSSLRIAVPKSCPPPCEAKRTQPQNSRSPGQQFYQQATSKAKAEPHTHHSYHSCDRIPFVNFNRKDIQAWLD